MIFSLSTVLSGLRNASFLSRQATKVIKETLNPPKDIGNAYSMFYTDFYASARRQNPQIKPVEATKEAASRWRSMSESQKQSYKDKAKNLQSEYKQKKVSFLESLNPRQRAAFELLGLSRRGMRGAATRRDLSSQHKAVLDSMPSASGISPRGLFAAEQLKGHSGKELKDLVGEVSSKWTNLPASEKQNYAERAAQNLAQFNSGMKRFLGK